MPALVAGTAAHGQEAEAAQAFASPVAEFSDACRNLDKVDDVRANLVARGWQRIGLEDNPLIDTLVREWESGLVGQNAEKLSEHEVYAKDFMGRGLLLLLKDYNTPHSRSIARWTTCDLFDFGQPPALEDLHAVLGSQRVDRRHEPYFPDASPDSLLGISWHEPFALEGSTITKVQTVPAEYYGVSYVNYSSVEWHDRDPAENPQWSSIPTVPPPPVRHSQRD